jgi:formylglycine-generating enzyme required for sulfatase activity
VSRIFISYRRKEGSKDAMALFERLARHFGADAVFMDVDGIPLGVDFQEVLDRTLDTCSVMLLLMGPDWAEAKDESGERRLDDPNDLVRVEVATALRRNIPLIPVFVDGARMPRGNRLPEDLAALPRRQGMRLDHDNWRVQTGGLIQELERCLQVPQAKPGAVFRDSPDTPEMVVIPAGEFMMGEGTQHKVTIARPFAVGKYPLTFDEWDACVKAGGCKHKPEDAGWGRGNRPVINVTWEDAQAYVAWLSKKTGKPYRLLSEAEWEYAARAGTTTRYPWGDEPGTNRANFRGSGSQWSGKQTAPVGSFEPNAFGLYDMIGNVWEWLQDCWNDSYDGAPTDGSAWESGDCGRRVVRGGSWGYGPESARVADRIRSNPTIRIIDQGFRLARTL